MTFIINGRNRSINNYIALITIVITIYFYCNRDGLFAIDVVKGIDDRERSYDDFTERRELEKTAAMLFGKI